MNVQHQAGKTEAGDDPGSSNSAEADPPEPASTGDIPEIEVFAQAGAETGVDLRRLRHGIMRAIGELGVPVARLVVQLIDDQTMSELHKRSCGVAGPTDVLTFPTNGASRAGASIDADIAIDLDEAARQAKARGHSTEQEVLLYAIHGVLHCVGYDDHNASDYQAMHAEEDRILAAIGVGETFGTGGSSEEGA